MIQPVNSAWCVRAALLTSLVATCSSAATAIPAPAQGTGPFERIASFPVFENTDVDAETVAEIVAYGKAGNLLVYTDSETEVLGFVDITDPANPQADGVVDLSGEPTSVAVAGNFALACVNTSADFVNTSGSLEVIDLDTRQVVATLPLGGQPDAIAVSPLGTYAAIAIENERDEDLGDGEPPQAPPGFVVIVDLVGAPSAWTTRQVDLVGVPDLFPDDPEPEFVDINAADIAVVTLQENNHIVLIRLADGAVVGDFSAGTANLRDVDTVEDDLIDATGNLAAVPREPDAVAWISPFTFATADEGDLFGGSRGFTTWASFGLPLFEARNLVEIGTQRIGHYPEGRSENKGNEPEGAEYGVYGGDRFLFIGSERANVVFVYQLNTGPFFGSGLPRLRQILPTGVGPEGLLAIPERDLFVVACEVDARDDKVRSTLMIYERSNTSSYPNIESVNRTDSRLPIPWGALSALAVEDGDDDTLYAVHDSFYKRSRVFTLDRSSTPARIIEETELRDESGVLAGALQDLEAQLPGTDDFDPSALVNADGTVNLDLEGLDVSAETDFWFVSEGRGNLVDGVSDPDDRPFESPNLLVRAVISPGIPPFVEPFNAITEVVLPPLAVTRNQLRFGYEGVAVVEDAFGDAASVYVAFQRAWQAGGDPSDRARIGRYDLATRTWSYAHYPLDVPASPAGGWVGLSELVHLGGDDFAVLERDNQGGPDAAIKRVYEMSVAGVQFKDESQVASFELLSKSLALDLLAADVYGPTAGPIPEKQEGMAVLSDGTCVIVNDNDGVDDNNGETRLVVIPGLF